ncbi:hypothetical protein LI90_4386 (plasmid) [Carbonactinospora thermoautotrophica]|uniref:Uncharacterized protein n=1 Tax=Carbonactinospora thermoautotrophica TaxID=1469144 RepID=A0A132MHV1_9ACTN|nr:hypothetical protein [Carbonactinospora thermoautotrophica]KWW97414.1 hypothetical protein LI90_4386 [Carbonactinospora thermoautotrophica]
MNPTHDDGPGRLGPAELIARLQQHRLIAEAEDAARGVRHLTVWHGDPERREDVLLLAILIREFWSLVAGRDRPATVGGNDYTSFRIPPPDADTALTRLTELAHQLDPGWWRIVQGTP